MPGRGKQTEVLRLGATPDSNLEVIREAAGALRDGGIAAFPTDTVYGLGCDAGNLKAVQGIYAAKGREKDKPLVLFVAAVEEAFALACESEAARDLAKGFWPGPLTLVLKAKRGCPRPVVAQDGTVAIRMPNHKVPLALVKSFGKPLATTSANLSGEPEATEPATVMAQFFGEIDLLLDGGKLPRSLTSTVVAVGAEGVQILRRGRISKPELEKMVPDVREKRSFQILFVCTGNSCRSPLAEGLMKKKVADLGLSDIQVSSAGVACLDGMRAAENAVLAAKESGADINRHRTRSVHSAMITGSDLTVVMEPRHKQEVLDLVPEARGRVFLLTELGSPPGDRGIKDPIGEPLEAYRACRDEIARCLDGVVAKIKELRGN